VKKKPRFFCDNCGYEVGSDVKACPHCGRYFAAIRCPVCDYSGPDKMFQNGCPMCGYSSAPPPKVYTPRDKKHRHGGSEPLPGWALLLSILGLLFVVLLLAWLITR
jgi:hypothetical protein